MTFAAKQGDISIKISQGIETIVVFVSKEKLTSSCLEENDWTNSIRASKVGINKCSTKEYYTIVFE
jgi:hypothetical protein